MHLNTKYTKNSRQNKSQLSNVIGSAIDDDDADAGADVLVDADVDVDAGGHGVIPCLMS